MRPPDGALAGVQPLDEHPAKFSAAVLAEMAPFLEGRRRVLDPMAGVGRLAEIRPDAYLNELEPEWALAAARRYPDATVTCGDARRLGEEYGTRFFDAVATSPSFGNRMADHHEARDFCRSCEGAWQRQSDDSLRVWVACSACGGSGLSKRHTYRHVLGRPLSPHSTASLQWTQPAYRQLHEKIWRTVLDLLAPDGILVLNISDHVRKGQVEPVVAWHVGILTLLGARLVAGRKVSTPRQRHGANGSVRVPHEYVLAFEKFALGRDLP